MAETKMTKRELFESTIAVLTRLGDEGTINADKAGVLVAGLKHELELVNRKRNSSNGADAKRKAEQDAIKVRIADLLADAEVPLRATDIANGLNDGTTVQRVSALVKQMVDVGEVAREQDKKVVTFTLV